MVGVQSVLEGVVETFGPFLIPVTLFAIGVVGYTVLFLINRQFRSNDAESRDNRSPGTPRSATDNDHEAGTRNGGPTETQADGAEQRGPGRRGTSGSDSGADEPTGRADDPLRRNN